MGSGSHLNDTMENCFETSQEKTNFQDNSCRAEKLRESYLILKQKICKSHELIQRYNDKIKECERLKTDLATANNEVKRMASNYNTSLAKVIRIELENTKHKKRIELLESKVENYETKALTDQNYIEQLNCKMKEIHRKHAEKVAKYDLQVSALQANITELQHELTAAKRICERTEDRATSDQSDEDEDAIAEKKFKIDATTTVDVGVNTVNFYLIPALTARDTADACTYTDKFHNPHADNLYPLFCEKCEAVLHPPPLDKICRIMKECPKMVEEFKSPPAATQPPTSPLRSVSFPQLATHNNPAHSTPVSSPPPAAPPPPPLPPPSPAMEKVFDQRPLVRMLMKRVNRLEMRIDAQNSARNRSIDTHCRPICLHDTVTSVSEFFREVTKVAAVSRENSKLSSGVTRDSGIRVSKLPRLRPKVRAIRSRLPLVSSCSGVWEVNSLRKIQNENGNKVRRKDIRKPSNLSSKMARIVQRQVSTKSVISNPSLHSLSESEVSDSMSFSYDTLSDNNKKKIANTILPYDEESSTNGNKNYKAKIEHPVIEKMDSSEDGITLNECKIPVNDEKALKKERGYKISRKELFTSDSDDNDVEHDGAPNKNESVMDFSNINSYNGIKVSSCSDSDTQQSILSSNSGDNVVNDQQVSINNETEKNLSGEASIVSERLSIESRTSDRDNEMSPPAKMIGVSYTPASDNNDMDTTTEMAAPLTIPTECTRPKPTVNVSSLSAMESSTTSCSKVASCEKNTEIAPATEFTVNGDHSNPSNEEHIIVKNDVDAVKMHIPFRPILVPVRKCQRQIKIRKCTQPENFRQPINACKNNEAIVENGRNDCIAVKVHEEEKELSRDTKVEIKTKQESHETFENGMNELESNENDNLRETVCENGIRSDSAEDYDPSVSATPIELLQRDIRKKDISVKTVGGKQSQKKKLKKKLGGSIELTDAFVKKQFQKLIDSEWDLLLHNDILEKLSKACSARIIAKLSIEFLSELTKKDSELDRTHTPPAPLMTKGQQKMVTLLVELDPIKPGVIRYVQAGIQYKLFRLNNAPEREIIENLGRVYVVLARILKDREILRIFCCDALYCLGLGAISIIYTVLTCWPEVFPVRRENVDILPKCIAHFILQQKAVAYFPKLLPLKNLITGLYTYSSASLVKADLLKELLSNLENETQNGLYTAVILFAKREGLSWTYKNIVRDGLLPMIIGQRHPNVYAAFCLLGNLMRSFPVADTDGTVGEIVNQLCDLMNSGEGSDEQQEGVASALLSLSRHRFESVAQAVLAWQSKTPLRQRTIEQLQVLFDSKPVDFWRSFIKKKKNSTSIVT